MTPLPLKKKASFPRKERKTNRNLGFTYVSSKGKHVPKKEYEFVDCNCRYKCALALPSEEREKIFKSYWKLGSWDLQSSFILQSVICSQPERRTINARVNDGKIYRVNFSRQYFLGGKKICKNAYMNSLSISHMRIDYCLKKKSKPNMGVSSPDKRGKVTPNKTKPEIIDAVEQFLDSFPKYFSHYSASKRAYFRPDLSKTKIFNLYVDSRKDGERYVSKTLFLREFKKYNIGIYVPKKDTCQTCDRLDIQIKAEYDLGKKSEVQGMLNHHHQKANHARASIQNAMLNASNDKRTLCFSFDMEKTQPIPYLNTSVVFYKRQLWLYNLGIQTMHNKTSYMCLWTEVEGKRGSREVSSCIEAVLQSIDLTGVERIKSYSNSCGGQNRNKNIVSFMMYVCSVYGIKEWEHCYLECGHSYLPNDTDFGVIERMKNKQVNIYTPEHWFSLISKAKRSFKTIIMKDQFRNYDELPKRLNFRHKNSEGQPFNWLQVEKDSNIVGYKTTNDPDATISQVDFDRRGVSMPLTICP